MIIEHHEIIASDFEGTVIDLETIGDFNGLYKYDSRRYKDIRQVILGYVRKDHLHIYCAQDMQDIEKLRTMTPEIVKALSRPFYAFNCEFESSVWFHHIGIQIDFDGELQSARFEKKKDTVRQCGISNYDDPFFDLGFMCMNAWNTKEFDKAIVHNRACLLKERDILIQRGHTQPVKVKFVK
jgi:hypothetical protein